MIVDEEKNEERNIMLEVTNEVPVGDEELETLTGSVFSFRHRKHIDTAVISNGKIYVLFAYDNIHDYEEILNSGIFHYMDGESGTPVKLINLDKLLENALIWSEFTVMNDDISFVGYRYLTHGELYNVDMYVTFLMGDLYQEFVDYVHNKVLNNLKKVCEIRDRLHSSTEEVENVSEEE